MMIWYKKTNWLCAFCIVILVAVFVGAQQPTPCGVSNDVRIVQEKPTVYLTFERFGKALNRGEQKLLQNDQRGISQQKGDDVWLRVHNNTCWPISLIQYGMYVPKQQPGEAPGERFKRMGILDDGAETGLFYAVMKDRNQIGYSGIDSYDYVKLLPGRTTLFSATRAALKDQQSIRISFIYDWEFQRGAERKGYTVNEPWHYIEFSAYDLKTQSEN
jgi:hypothetical protein